MSGLDEKRNAMDYLVKNDLPAIIERMANDLARARPADPLTYMVSSLTVNYFGSMRGSMISDIDWLN